MEYRANFYLGLLSSCLTLLGALFGLLLLYQGVQAGGWRLEEALLVLSAFTLLQGLGSTLLAPNLNKIVEHVQQGTLDFVLLKPIDPQFWLSFRAFSPWGLGDFLLGMGLLLYAGERLGLGLGGYLLFLFYLALGSVMLYSLWFLLATTSIWFVKIYNVTEVLRGLLEAGRFPWGAIPPFTGSSSPSWYPWPSSPPCPRKRPWGGERPPLPPSSSPLAFWPWPGVFPPGLEELHLGEQLGPPIGPRHSLGSDIGARAEGRMRGHDGSGLDAPSRLPLRLRARRGAGGPHLRGGPPQGGLGEYRGHQRPPRFGLGPGFGGGLL